MSEEDGGDAPLSPTMSRAPRYADEDISPTTDRELQGWYCYGMAAEIFAVVGSGSFLPVTMEQLARENGVLWSDRSTPCVGADKTGKKLTTRASDGGGGGASSDKDQCVVNLFGADITTSSFAMYTFSIAVFIQALALVSFSTVADHGEPSHSIFLPAIGVY
jgi:MFS transporter, UMF1 family